MSEKSQDEKELEEQFDEFEEGDTKKEEKEIAFNADMEGLSLNVQKEQVVNLDLSESIRFALSKGQAKVQLEVIEGVLKVKMADGKEDHIIAIDINELIKFGISKTKTKLDDKAYSLVGEGIIRKISFEKDLN